MKIFMIFKKFLLHTVGDSQLFSNIWQLNDMDSAERWPWPPVGAVVRQGRQYWRWREDEGRLRHAQAVEWCEWLFFSGELHGENLELCGNMIVV